MAPQQREVAAIVRMVPYALHAHRTRAAAAAAGRLLSASYGPLPSNAADVYLPPGAQTLSPPASEPVPLAVFVYGGVWSTGEPWQYAPLAAALADAGSVAVVVRYSLWPAALVPQMASEVSAALAWAQRSAPQWGADAARTTLIGHSAGAHLCALALLDPQAGGGQAGDAQGGGEGREPPQPPLAAFVGMCGVFDVARHFEFESWRGVGSLSTMRPAMGGDAGFAPLSPALLAAAAPAAAAALPPVVLLSSEGDTTVPWEQASSPRTVRGQSADSPRIAASPQLAGSPPPPALAPAPPAALAPRCAGRAAGGAAGGGRRALHPGCVLALGPRGLWHKLGRLGRARAQPPPQGGR